jgi:hypothetical protein
VSSSAATARPGRTIVLAGTDGSAPSALPRGSPETLGIALARVAELMDRQEDVLILFTTSHGAPFGLYYNDADNGYGAISPSRLRLMLDELGLSNRLLILSACYSGIFVPALRFGRDRDRHRGFAPTVPRSAARPRMTGPISATR